MVAPLGTISVENSPPSTRTAHPDFFSTSYPQLAIILTGICARLLYHLAYHPLWYPDSPTYSTAWSFWSQGFFTDGGRTPLYPMFLGLMQAFANRPAITVLNDLVGQYAVLFQSILGLWAACLLYSTMRTLAIRPRIAFIAALVFSVLHITCLFEMVLLTETLSLFSIVLFLWLVANTTRRISTQKPIRNFAIWTGIVAGCSILIRPENLGFVLIVVTMLGLGTFRIAPRLRVRLAGAIVLILVATAPLVLSWMTFNYIGVGKFSLTTASNWTSIQPVYNLFDRVEPEDRLLGEILTRSYEKSKRDGQGERRDHFWIAYDELTARNRELPVERGYDHQQRSALGAWLYSLPSAKSRFYTLRYDCGASIRPNVTLERANSVGNYIAFVCRGLRHKYPGIWLRNAVGDFKDTFGFIYWQPTDRGAAAVGGGSIARIPTLANLTAGCNRLQAPLLTVLYLVTLCLACYSPFALWRSARDNSLRDVTVTSFALATTGLFVAYCLLSGYYNRYSTPQLGVFFLCGAYAIERLLARTQTHIWSRQSKSPRV